MSDETRQDPHGPPAGADDVSLEDRRAFLRRIARGVAYTSPVIATFAAPSSAVAQVSAPMMMLTLCDYFPVLCQWLGGIQQQNSIQAPGDVAPAPWTTAPPTGMLPQAPWNRPPPGTRLKP